jgi:hypothetical protein
LALKSDKTRDRGARRSESLAANEANDRAQANRQPKKSGSE